MNNFFLLWQLCMGQPAGLMRALPWWTGQGSEGRELLPCYGRGATRGNPAPARTRHSTMLVMRYLAYFTTWNVLIVKSGWLDVKDNKRDSSREQNWAESCCKTGLSCLQALHQPSLWKANSFRPTILAMSLSYSGKMWLIPGLCRRITLLKTSQRGLGCTEQELGMEEPRWGYCCGACWILSPCSVSSNHWEQENFPFLPVISFSVRYISSSIVWWGIHFKHLR